MKGLALLVIGCLAACADERARPEQPISFSHKIHAGDQAIPCVDCHDGAETRAHASLPPLPRCLACHMKPQGDPAHPRDQRVRELASKPGPFKWVQVTRNPAHVHFSHSAHVSVAKMPCQDCHGDVAAWTRPPTTPIRALTSMDACLACHREKGASTRCATCHK